MTKNKDSYRRLQRNDFHAFTATLTENIQRVREGVMSREDLYHRYEPELNSWRKARRRPYAEMHPSIHDPVDFLELVILKIGPRRSPKYCLDRLNNDQYQYHPDYLRWAKAMEQAQNRTTTKIVEAVDPTTGEIIKLSQPEWSVRPQQKRLGLTLSIFHKRFSDGWTAQQVLFTPKGRRRISNSVEPLPQNPSNDTDVARRCYAVFERARLKAFPSAPPTLDSGEKVILKPVIHFWARQGGDPEWMIEFLFTYYEEVVWRLEQTIWKVPAVPSPSFISKYKTQLFEAIHHVDRCKRENRERDAKAERQQQEKQERDRLAAEDEVAFSAWCTEHIEPRLEQILGSTWRAITNWDGPFDYRQLDQTRLQTRWFWNGNRNALGPPPLEWWVSQFGESAYTILDGPTLTLQSMSLNRAINVTH